MAHNEEHNALVREALQELAIQGYTAWKNETGCWFDYTIVNGKLKKGRPHPYGKIGSGDIMGILPRKVTLPGRGEVTIGQHAEFEAKTGVGRQGENQEGHQEFAVERNGGLYILFRSVPELMQKLKAAA